MKKIFTFAAAILASMAMMAQTNVFEWGDMTQSAQPDPSVGTLEVVNLDGYASVKINTNANTVYGLKCGSSMMSSNKVAKCIKIKPAAGETFAAGDTVIYSHVYNNSATKTTNISVATFENNTIVYTGSQTVNGRLEDGYTTDKFVLAAAADSLALGRVGETSTFILSIKVVRPAPTTTPVTSVVVNAPKTSTIVGRPITLSASADVMADEYAWLLNGEAVEGADAASFVFTPEAAGSYQIAAKARNSFNGEEWAVSEAVAITVNEAQAELVVVDNDIVWNWDGAASENITPTDANSEYIFANVADSWSEDFAADKIAGKAQYFCYTSNKCCQGHYLKFIVSAPGKITVEFSNTGTSDRPYRHLFVNGVDTEQKSKNVDKVTLENYAVAAGEVLLEGMMENGEDPMTANMLRFYKVTFTKDQGTGIDNVEESVKAVKVVRNGQLFIEKNGVLYNAQGAVVK